MNVLSLDTATGTCGIGLLLDGGAWFDYTAAAGMHHAEHLSEGLHRILGDAGISVSGLDLIVCSKGPGSFTGLRIGMATAKGLAAGAGVPLVSVPTLDAMAFGLEWAPAAVVPVIDAKKSRVYAAAYRNGERIRGPFDLELAEMGPFVAAMGTVVLTGPGAALAATACLSAPMPVIDKNRMSWNRGYVELGIAQFERSGQDGPDSGPEYLRKSDAELELEKGKKHD